MASLICEVHLWCVREDAVFVRDTDFSSFKYCDKSQQVWSLTQFYSVDFSQSRICIKKCVFNKPTIKVCVSSFLWCPGTSGPSATHLTVSLFLGSSRNNTRGKSKTLEGLFEPTRPPSRTLDSTRALLPELQRNKDTVSCAAPAWRSQGPGHCQN